MVSSHYTTGNGMTRYFGVMIFEEDPHAEYAEYAEGRSK
jgi:hypothetical protein